MADSDLSLIHAAVLTPHAELGEGFLTDLCGDACSEVVIGPSRVNLTVLKQNPVDSPEWIADVTDSDVYVFVLRFMDAATLSSIRSMWKSLPQQSVLPVCMLIYREQEEHDFKMGCPDCSQKLWVRDQDAGKRGRCPNCKKAFRLPRQEDYLRQYLRLPDVVPVARFVRGDHSEALQALQRVIDRCAGRMTTSIPEIDEAALKKATLRVEISDADMDE